MVIAVFFCFYFQCKNKEIKWHYVATTALCFLAILFSFTRSIFLSALIGLFLSVFLVLLSGHGRILFKHLLFSTIVVAVLLIGAYLAFGANYLGFAYQRTAGSDVVPEKNAVPQENGEAAPNQDVLDNLNDDAGYIDRSKNPREQTDAYLHYSEIVSDQYRQYTLSAMLAKIKISPIVGNGLGAVIKYRDYNEFFYLDVMMKMGIIGLLLYLAPAFLCGYWFFREIKYLRRGPPYNIQMLLVGVIVAGFLAVCIFSFFNPYLNAALGIMMYSFGIAAVLLLKEHKDGFLKQI